MKEKIVIEITKAELIILSELLYRVNSNWVLSSFFQDKSEQIALFNLESKLEKCNNYVFEWSYISVLNEARRTIE